MHVAADWIAGIRAAQQHLVESGAHDDGYDVPYSTIHVGTIHGGKALNIVPNECTLEFEIRTLASDNADAILGDIRSRASIASATAFQGKAHLPDVEEVNAYPGLDTRVASNAVKFLETLLPPNTQKRKVAFGTEGGLFSTRLSVPSVVCGPGDIGVAHKPDEYVALAQLDACDNFLAQLTSRLQ
ncbi:M20/M25/M40 family metallo-hydrolase [Paraburkholderia heleia]|uniref:M20/M25/M40 family metallo-hydrolase n=1 Tax=Paraburkholderia heleia TaxID=634127 RepID=UPI0031E22526